MTLKKAFFFILIACAIKQILNNNNEYVVVPHLASFSPSEQLSLKVGTFIRLSTCAILSDFVRLEVKCPLQTGFVALTG